MARATRSYRRLAVCLVFCACGAAEDAITSASPSGAEASAPLDAGSFEPPASAESGVVIIAPPIYEAGVIETSPVDASPIQSDFDADGGRCRKDVDLVFVMDISGSMVPFFEQLDTEILVVEQTLTSLSLPNPHHYGLVVFVDDVEVTKGGAPYTDVEELRQAFTNWAWAAGLNQIHVPQFNGSFTENSLDALHAAATQFQWRDAASTHRMIVHVTDDTFFDGPGSPLQCEAPAADGCATFGSMQRYPDVIETLRSRKIWTFAFAAHVRPLSFGFVDTSAGFFGNWNGMPSIPRATGGEAWEIIDVLLGAASLSSSINEAVLGKRCEIFPPVLPPPAPVL